MPVFDFVCGECKRKEPHLVDARCAVLVCDGCGSAMTRQFPVEAIRGARFAPWDAPLHSQDEERARARARDHFDRTVNDKLGSGDYELDSGDPFSDNMDGDAASSSVTSLIETGNVAAIRCG